MGHEREEESAKSIAPSPAPAPARKHVDKRAAASKRLEADQAKQSAASRMKTTLYVVADILKEQRSTMIAGAPEGARIGLTELHVAATGKRKNLPIDGAARRTAFDTAMLLVEPKIAQYRKELEDPEWLAEQITNRLARLRTEVLLAEAAHRTSTAVRIGENHIHEDTDDARTTGQALHAELPRVVATIKLVSEQMVRVGHEQLHDEAEAMLQAKVHGHADNIGSFADLLGAFSLAEGLLMLSDKQFLEHVKHAHGISNRISTYAELVKAVVEILGGAISVTAYVTSKIAKAGAKIQATRIGPVVQARV